VSIISRSKGGLHDAEQVPFHKTKEPPLQGLVQVVRDPSLAAGDKGDSHVGEQDDPTR